MRAHGILLPLALVSAACASSGALSPDLASRNALEVRQVQSRSFEDADVRQVLKAAISALQDEGYVIQHADAELGLVTAVMQWRSRKENKALKVLKWAAAASTYGASLLIDSGTTEFTSIEACLNLTQDATSVRARVSLSTRTIDKKGELRRVEPVSDAAAHQALLARLDKAMFLEKQGL